MVCKGQTVVMLVMAVVILVMIMVMLVRADKMVLSGLVFARKIARMI